MATTLGCSKCHTLLAHDGCVKDKWPAVCLKCGNAGSFQSWAGSPTWEKEQAEEFAKQPSQLAGAKGTLAVPIHNPTDWKLGCKSRSKKGSSSDP